MRYLIGLVAVVLIGAAAIWASLQPPANPAAPWPPVYERLASEERWDEACRLLEAARLANDPRASDLAMPAALDAIVPAARGLMGCMLYLFSPLEPGVAERAETPFRQSAHVEFEWQWHRWRALGTWADLPTLAGQYGLWARCWAPFDRERVVDHDRVRRVLYEITGDEDHRSPAREAIRARCAEALIARAEAMRDGPGPFANLSAAFRDLYRASQIAAPASPDAEILAWDWVREGRIADFWNPACARKADSVRRIGASVAEDPGQGTAAVFGPDGAARECLFDVQVPEREALKWRRPLPEARY